MPWPEASPQEERLLVLQVRELPGDSHYHQVHEALFPYCSPTPSSRETCGSWRSFNIIFYLRIKSFKCILITLTVL